jgi:hypothetical protein
MGFDKRGMARGLFRGKRAQTEHESLWTIIELTFFALFIVSLLLFVFNVWKNTTYEKNFLARDLALTLDTLYMSPQQVEWLYPHNATDYKLMMSLNNVKVGSIGSTSKQDERRYWFADKEANKLDYMTQPLIGPAHMLFRISPTSALVIKADSLKTPIQPSTSTNEEDGGTI